MNSEKCDSSGWRVKMDNKSIEPRRIGFKNVMSRLYLAVQDNAIIGVIAFGAFLIPQEYAIGSILHNIWQLLIVLLGLLLLVLYLYTKQYSARWAALCFLYFQFYLGSSLLNGVDNSIAGTLYCTIKGVGFASLCDIQLLGNKKQLLRSASIAGLIMCSLHLLTVFAYFNVRGGMRGGYINPDLGRSYSTIQNWYLLTYDNESILFFIPVIVVAVIYGIIYNRKAIVASAVLGVLTLTTYYLKGAITAFVALSAFLCLLVILWLLRCLNLLRLINVSSRTEAGIILFVGVVLAAIVVVVVTSGAFGNLAILVGKDPTFSGRTQIWDSAISQISHSPIIGFGYQSSSEIISKIGHTHCHNIILELLYTGGVPCLAAYIVFLLACVPRRFNDKYIIISMICIAGIVCLEIVSWMDWYPTIPIQFLPLLLLGLSGDETKMVYNKNKARLH